jgi:hypothetical protein
MDKYVQILLNVFKKAYEISKMAGNHIKKQYQMTKKHYFLFAMRISYLYNPHRFRPVPRGRTGRSNQNPGAAQFNNILSTIPLF